MMGPGVAIPRFAKSTEAKSTAAAPQRLPPIGAPAGSRVVNSVITADVPRAIED